MERLQAPSLVSLCVGVVGKDLEHCIAAFNRFPPDIKMALTAVARRRHLLDDEVIVSLADDSWVILDISGSNVSDKGLIELAGICGSLRAVDISRCKNISGKGVSAVLQHCHSLETLRCGGFPRNGFTARGCLEILKPKLPDVDVDSWEDFDSDTIIGGAQLRFLVWPRIDKNILEDFSADCPRVTVNPDLSSRRGGSQVPREAWPNIILDEPFVQDIDPKTWAVSGFRLSSPTSELSLAEKFRRAYDGLDNRPPPEPDKRLTRKREKNMRQHQRRARRQ